MSEDLNTTIIPEKMNRDLNIIDLELYNKIVERYNEVDNIIDEFNTAMTNLKRNKDLLNEPYYVEVCNTLTTSFKIRIANCVIKQHSSV